jgi:hypothetical protein
MLATSTTVEAALSLRCQSETSVFHCRQQQDSISTQTARSCSQTAIKFQQVAGRIVCILYFFYPFLFSFDDVHQFDTGGMTVPSTAKRIGQQQGRVFFFSRKGAILLCTVAVFPSNRQAIIFKHKIDNACI